MSVIKFPFGHVDFTCKIKIDFYLILNLLKESEFCAVKFHFVMILSSFLITENNFLFSMMKISNGLDIELINCLNDLH